MSEAVATDDRRARILDAALTEFAEKGYERASTNAIAKEAGAAKGLVFHYFGSKEALFLAVADDVLASLVPRFEEAVQDAPPDLFARLLAWTERKLVLMREDPRRLRFFLVALVDAPEAVRDQARQRSEVLMRSLLPRLLSGVDTSRLRPGVSLEEAFEAIWTLSAGFEQKLRPVFERRREESQAAVEAALGQARRLFELLREGIYSR